MRGWGWCLGLCLSALLAAAPALAAKPVAAKPVAAAPASATVPADPASNLVLAQFGKVGAKLYPLGSYEGTQGWLIVNGSRVQTAYTQGSSQSVMFGILIGAAGENVSIEQAKALLATHGELTEILTPYITAAAASNTAPAAAAAASASPGERLFAELQNAPGVMVGNAAAPLVLMVMDPDCPHCQATWKSLHDAVMKQGKLQLRLIPVTVVDKDNAHEANFLGLSDPATTWDKYIAGDKSLLGMPPDPARVLAIDANDSLADRWSIPMTPYLVYRDKGGKVKLIEGEPQVAALLADLGQ